MRKPEQKAGGEHSPGRKLQHGVTVLETVIAMSMSMVMLTSIVVLYVGAAKSSAREDVTLNIQDDQRLVSERLTREMKMAGMVAPEDADGDSNDISHDVPNMAWSDSLFEDLEYANTYFMVISSDIDGDDHTETVAYYLSGTDAYQRIWEWNRDSLEWSEEGARCIASNVDHLMFIFYDNDLVGVPAAENFPDAGFTLSHGERIRVTAIEMILVTRAGEETNGHRDYLNLPDGTYFYDQYKRSVQRFMIQGRNMNVGA